MNSPKKSLPERPNLEFHKKQAKARVRAGEFPTQSCALYALASEHGFPSWPTLKRFVEARRLERDARRALAVRAACSNDVREALALVSVEPELALDDIYAAATFGESDYVETWLASERARVNENGGPNNWQPLLYACFSRVARADATRRTGLARIVELLLEAGADANAHFLDTEHDNELQAALFGAAGIANDSRMTRALLAAGADPNDHETLYHAAEFDDLACLRLLLEAKPKPEWVSYCFRRSLDMRNEARALLFLEHGADPNLKLRPGLRPALHQAVFMFQSPRAIEAMLEHGANANEVFEGVSVYRQALRLGRGDVQLLLERHGADPSDVTAADRALAACFGAHGKPDASAEPAVSDVVALAGHAARRGDLRSVEALFALGPSVDTRENRGAVMHLACWTGRADIVRYLLERGVDFDQKSEWGASFLSGTQHGSLHCQDPDGGMGTKLPEEAHAGDYAAIVRLLLERGFPLPGRADFGSFAVRGVLREFGAADD